MVIVTNDTSTGANVLVTFQNALAQATSQLLTSTTPGVSISTATINAANNIPGSGIPIALSSGQSVTSGSFTLQYNPALLNISGVVSKIAGASFTLSNTINSATSATAVLSLSSPSPISSSTTAITLGSLLATVPLSAAADYGAKQLLHFSSEQLNGTAGPIPVTNEDGVQVAAYFGDVTGTGGPLTLADATAISTASGGIPNPLAQTLPGFAAFPTLDPVIIGDVALQGSVNSTDAGAMLQQVAGNAKNTIPYAPIGLPVTPQSQALHVLDSGESQQLPVAGGNPVGSPIAASVRPAAVVQAEIAPTPTVLGNQLSSAALEHVFSDLVQNTYSLSTTTDPQPAATWSQPNVYYQGYLASAADLLDGVAPMGEDADPLMLFFAQEGAKGRGLPHSY